MKCTSCGTQVKPVVSVDIDGTIANYHRHLFRFADGWLGTQKWQEWDENYHGDKELSDFMGLDKRTYRELKLAFRQGGLKRSMPPIDGWAPLFSTLMKLDVEIWVSTTRPYLQVGNVDDDTREWLRRWRVPYDHLLYSDNKYQELVDQVGAERVACVLDDQVFPEYHDAHRLRLNPILVLSTYNKAMVDAMGNFTGTNELASFAEGLYDAARMVEEAVAAWRNKHDAA